LLSGPAKEIITHDKHHGHSVDYVSKPDYQFEYGVEDPKSQVSQFRKEHRQDDAVVGEYSYTDPFGHVRTVKYTADKLHGFRAEIYVDGKLETPHSSSHQDAHATAQPEQQQPPQQQQHVTHDGENDSDQYEDSNSKDYSGSSEDY
jgi:Insect cuticle protein